MSINLEGANGGNIALSTGGLAAGTNTGTFKTASTINFAIGGIFRTAKTATDNIAFSSGHTNLVSGQKCAVAVYLDASGNFSTVQGPIVSSADASAPLPNPASDRACVGVLVISAAATFTFGTTGLGASNITTTYYNTVLLPGASL